VNYLPLSTSNGIIVYNCRVKTLAFLCFFTFSSQLFANNWVFDLSFGLGKGTFSHESFNQDISIVQSQASGSILYRTWSLLFIGFETRYEKILQMTKFEDANANVRGSMWTPVNPVLLIPLSKLAFRFSYQFFGDYKLKNKNDDDEEVIWKKVNGYRASLVLAELLPFGTYEFFYQKRKFAQQQIGSTVGDFLIKPELVTYGIEYKIIF